MNCRHRFHKAENGCVRCDKCGLVRAETDPCGLTVRDLHVAVQVLEQFSQVYHDNHKGGELTLLRLGAFDVAANAIREAAANVTLMGVTSSE